MLAVRKKIDLRKYAFSFERGKKVRDTVESMIADVRRRGDAAVVKYTRAFDCPLFEEEDIELTCAGAAIEPALARTILEAAGRIRTFAEAQLAGIDRIIKAGPCLQITEPIERVGVYAPGKKASLFSAVLMTAIPARVAGVKEIVLATPPRADKSIAPEIAFAARAAAVDRIIRVGGAQAIAALTFGTRRIPRVDKIVGPGNAYVQEAKRRLFGVVGIDSFAGPSEVAVLADATADAACVAWELMAQAEHGEDSVALLFTDSAKLAAAVKSIVSEEIKSQPRAKFIRESLSRNGAIFLVDDLGAAASAVNELAPEHLSLQVKDPRPFLRRIKTAGAVFVGRATPVASGDYWAGPSHVLPTAGTGRFSSHLGVRDFLREYAVIRFSKAQIRRDADRIAMLAEGEGLFGHARSVIVRRG